MQNAKRERKDRETGQNSLRAESQIHPPGRMAFRRFGPAEATDGLVVMVVVLMVALADNMSVTCSHGQYHRNQHNGDFNSLHSIILHFRCSLFAEQATCQYPTEN